MRTALPIIILFILLITKISYGATDEVVSSLKNIAGVYVKDQTGHVHQVDMRGFDSNNVLVLIDGRRTNSTDLSSVDWGQISLDQIEDIKVIKGPASVFYGDNSSGGVINLITKKGYTEEPKVEVDLFGATDDYYTQAFGISQKVKDWDYSLRYRHKHEGGYRENSSALVDNVGMNVQDNFDWGYVRVEGGNYDADFGLPGALSLSDIDTFGRKHSRFPNDKVTTNDKYIRTIVKYNGYELAGSFRNRSFDYTTTGFDSSSDSDYVNVDFKKYYILGDHILTTGANYQHNPTDIQTTFQDKARITKYDKGMFFEDTWFLGNWELSGGFRHDRAYYDFGDVKTHEINNIATGGVAYLFNNKNDTDGNTNKVYYNWGQGFRNPLTDEFYSFYTGLNTDVKSQSSVIHEVGYMYDTKDVRFETTVFQIGTDNEIYYDPNLFKNANLPETIRRGLEIAFEKQVLKDTKAFITYTYMATKVKGGGDIPQVPDNKYTLGLTQNLKWAVFSTQINYVGKRSFINDFSNLTGKQKAYKTVDLSLNKKISQANITLGVDNVLNEKYSDIGVFSSGTQYFYPNQGRTIYLSTKFVF